MHMALTEGSRLGPYEIEAPIGAGGMGEVYRAKDTRLDRVVAIKVLPEALKADASRRQRLEREAKAISQLSHPHICTLHDIGHANGLDFLVMEFIDGESLASWLSSGPLPMDDVLKYAAQMADALATAHKQGIVHRDLKPGNVMLTKSGVKLLDFGLAKVVEPSSTEAAMTQLPTLTTPLTEAGSIVGTFQYMAPEQLEGQPADARSDIFSLGSVLYEMATGQRAFTGKSQASLIVAVLKEEPAPISSIQPLTPPAFDRLVQTCLAKDPEDRFQTAHDVELQLRWIVEGGSQAGAPAAVSARRKSRERLAWGVAAAAILTAVALGIGFFLRAPKSPRVLRSTIELPPDLTVDPDNDSLAFSPDGETLAIAAADTKGTQQLYLRALDGPTPRALDGTKGATYPTWSPDGRWLAFFADGKLEKIDVTNGAVQTLATAPQGRGIAWGPDGTLIYAPDITGPLWKVSAGGSGASAIEKDVPKGSSHRDPRFLPDGKSILFASLSTGSSTGSTGKGADYGLYVLNLATGKSQGLLPDQSEGRFVPPGYLAFVRDDNLMVQPFDPASLKLSGEALLVAQKIQFDRYRGTAGYAFAGGDLLVYQPTSTGVLSQLTWFDSNGKELGTIAKPLAIAPNPFALRVSPDGRRAVAMVGARGQFRLWMIDLTSGVASPFTFGDQTAFGAVWSPDGESVIYRALVNQEGSGGVEAFFVKKADGGSVPERLAGPAVGNVVATDWSPDGSVVTYSSQRPETNSYDIGVVSMTGDHQVKTLVHSPANELGGSFSPDGKWLAYVSNESGSAQLYVIPYPGPGGKWQLTSNGSQDFFWVSDHEIYNQLEDGKVDAIELVPGEHGGLGIGSTRLLTDRLPAAKAASYSRTLKRFLLAVPTGGNHKSPITLVTNWIGELEGNG
jgi:Tol biopolymer transport system component/predicted Ser/Thr protein kinase